MKRNIEHVYSDTIGTMIPKYVTSTHPSDVYDGTTIYEWNESEASYVNGAEEIVFYETVSEDGYFCFGKDGEA